MTKIPKFVQWMVGGMTIFAVTAGTTAAVMRFRPWPWAANVAAHQGKPSGECKTIVRDPKPPINVRSSPIVAPDNVTHTLANGSQIIVIDEKVFNGNEQWLRISAPYQGWVSKKLTVTSCVPTITATTEQGPERGSEQGPERGAEILAKATEQYHAGQLETAIALAQTVPSDSLIQEAAQAAIVRWQADWKTAEATFNEAEQALNQGQWQDVVVKVEKLPDNRFWRDKFTPIVRRAVDQQHKAQRSAPKLAPKS
jgi:hypothetical protein